MVSDGIQAPASWCITEPAVAPQEDLVGCLATQTDISKKVIWNYWVSADQWVDERKIHVLAHLFPVPVGAQCSTFRWGSCWESQISCPITCTSSEPRNGHRSQSLCETRGQTGLHEGTLPRTGWDSRWGQVVLIKQVAQAWRTSGVQWDGEIQKWVWCTPLGLVYLQAVISAFPTVLKNETTPSNMRLSWKLLWFQLTLPIRCDLASHLLWNFLPEFYFIHLWSFFPY